MITRRLLTSVAVVVAVGMILACGGGLVSTEAERQQKRSADALWAAGEKPHAVREYKSLYQSTYVGTDVKTEILPRIVEHEIELGNTDEAKTWIKRGLLDDLKIEYGDPAAKKLFAIALTEHVAEQRKKREEAAARRARLNPATLAKYHRIETGMTPDEVHEIMGSWGKEQARVEAAGILTVSYSWQNQDGANMTVMFQNGKVTSKGQFGLR